MTEITAWNQAQLELAASIAHEVSQPLTAVIADANAGLRWLDRPVPNLEEARAALTHIIRSANRANQVVHGIRSFVTKGLSTVAPLDLNSLVRDVLSLTCTETQRNGVSLRTALTPDVLPVIGDRTQLQQVILNLVLNAIESNESVEGSRDLLVSSLREGPGQVAVAVRDSGRGIDPARQELLFQPFFTTKPGGMGMGLPLSRSMIESHGGRLWARPNEDRGATFGFSLPVAVDG